MRAGAVAGNGALDGGIRGTTRMWFRRPSKTIKFWFNLWLRPRPFGHGAEGRSRVPDGATSSPSSCSTQSNADRSYPDMVSERFALPGDLLRRAGRPRRLGSGEGQGDRTRGGDGPQTTGLESRVGPSTGSHAGEVLRPTCKLPMRMCSNRFVQIGMPGGRIRVLTTLRSGAAARLLGGDPGLSATRGHTLQTKPYRRGKQRQGEIILHFAQMHGKF
jgi:hypothetical protein